MLVLSRKHEESIMLGDDIEITIFIERGKVRVGITAPKDVAVHRKEVWEQIQKEKLIAG